MSRLRAWSRRPASRWGHAGSIAGAPARCAGQRCLGDVDRHRLIVLLVRPDEAFATAVEEDACPFKPLTSHGSQCYKTVSTSVNDSKLRSQSHAAVNTNTGHCDTKNDFGHSCNSCCRIICQFSRRVFFLYFFVPIVVCLLTPQPFFVLYSISIDIVI